MDFKKIDESFDRCKEKKFAARGLVKYLCYKKGCLYRGVGFMCLYT